MIDRNSSIPLHVQLTNVLVGLINNEAIAYGKLPSEAQLAKDYQVSRTTVRQALTNLEKAGEINKRHAVGTFVNDKPITHKIQHKTVTIVEALQEQGIDPLVSLIDFCQIESPKFVKEQIGDVLTKRLRRLYSHNNQPIALVDLYLPLAMSGVGEVLCRLDHRKATSYSVFENELHISIGEAKQVIRCLQLDKEIADALGVPESTTCMIMDRTTYSHNGTVLEFVRFYYASDIFQFELKLQRHETPLRITVADRMTGTNRN